MSESSAPASQGGVVEVRPATEAEIDAVGDLTARVYTGGGFVDEGHPYVRELRDARTRARGAELWVAVGSDASLLGAVTYCPAGSSFREVAATGEGEFRMLAVAPEARGRGVGRALVEACVSRSREDGCHAVALSSLEAMTDAHRLYERLGFVRTPGHDWQSPGGWLITYRRKLSEAPRT